MPKNSAQGVVTHDTPSTRHTDFLYRISLKCLIRNDKGEVLVVKESGRDYWDLPGGGMDHGESIIAAIAREMKEEVNLSGDFTYRVIAVDEPAYLKEHNFYQIRLIFELKPNNLTFSNGEDGDEISFIHPSVFQNSTIEVERRIDRYCYTARPEARNQ